MDRSLSKGTFALTSLWLSRADQLDYVAHQLEKELLSAEDNHDARAEERENLVLQASLDEDVAEILEIEAELRKGNRDEPASIHCSHKWSERHMG